MVEYLAGFVDNNEILSITKKYGGNLARVIKHMHITLVYKPTGTVLDEYYQYLGEIIKLEIKKYGNDGVNEGLMVEAISENEKLQKYLNKVLANTIPHITISVNDEQDENGLKVGKPVDTPKLFKNENSSYVKRTEKFTVYAKLGIYVVDGEKEKVKYTIC